jgi:hypothetical protein
VNSLVLNSRINVASEAMLQAAHRGYEYQDLMVALRLVDLVLGTVSSAEVDVKLVTDDRFDDLTIVESSGRRVRTQFKNRDDALIPLSLATFTSDTRDLRLDRLIASAIADRSQFANSIDGVQFRIVLRDACPIDPKLLGVLKAAATEVSPYVMGLTAC